MVKPETYTAKTREWNRAVASTDFKADFLRLERAPNGSWTSVVSVDLLVTMRDGRKVRTVQEVRIKGNQSGRIPHPNAFGKKKGRKK